jgi:uncharacterized protein (TIGR00369 family)
MKKLHNALASKSKGDYHCFGCSPGNPHGLKMEFWQDGEEVVSYFEPSWYYDGWEGIMHGGIIATMLDELGEWLIFTFLNTTGVTTRLNVSYKRPVKTKERKIEIRGRITGQKRNIIMIKAEVMDDEKRVCAHADIAYYAFSEKMARDEYNFPGSSAFTGNEK